MWLQVENQVAHCLNGKKLFRTATIGIHQNQFKTLYRDQTNGPLRIQDLIFNGASHWKYFMKR